MIKDSGNRTEFESGAVRDIQEGKGRCDLLPLDIIDLWCDYGVQNTLYHVGEYLKRKGSKGPEDYFGLILDHFAAEHQTKRFTSGEDDEMISLDQYKWNLVLEVAKHFEDGAKKYGDRNWEKGIPCDRYIDSAVRHYCKWRAGWDDEPHDRAFIWNIICCEWTRQRYGWNLERLEKKSNEPKSGLLFNWADIPNYVFTEATGDFHTKCLNHYYSRSSDVDQKIMAGSLEKTADRWRNTQKFIRSACEYLYDVNGHVAGRVWILIAEKSLDLCVAIDCLWTDRHNNDITPKMLEEKLVKQGWKPGVDFVVETFNGKSESKKFVQIGEQLAKSVRDTMDALLPIATAIVKKEDIKEDILAQIKEQEAKDQETANLKEACAIVEHYNDCYNSSTDFCFTKTCKECEHYINPDIVYKAVNQLLDHAKKSLENTEKSTKPSIEQCKRYIRCFDAEYSFCQGIDCKECPHHINSDKLYDEMKQIVAYFDKEENE